MTPIIFALVTYFCWGIGDVFGTIYSRKIGGYSSAFYFFLMGFLLNSLFIPFAFSDLHKFTIQSLLISTILGILAPLPLMAFYEGLKVGNAALVGTITSSFAAISVLFSIVFLGETISFSQAMFITVILLGTIISSLDFGQLKDSKFLVDRGVPYAILAMVLWGIYFAFIKIPIQQVGWFWPGYISFLGSPLVLIFMKIRGIKLVKPSKSIFILLLLSSILITVGGFSYNFAISQGMVALVAPIASSAVTLFIFLAFLFFKDPITKQQIAGIITTLIGIVLLSIFSA